MCVYQRRDSVCCVAAIRGTTHFAWKHSLMAWHQSNTTIDPAAQQKKALIVRWSLCEGMSPTVNHLYVYIYKRNLCCWNPTAHAHAHTAGHEITSNW